VHPAERQDHESAAIRLRKSISSLRSVRSGEPVPRHPSWPPWDPWGTLWASLDHPQQSDPGRQV